MFRWLKNLSSIGDSLLISTSFKFNHCSTICPYHGGVLLAWYSGTGECCDDQSVYVISIDGLQQSEPLRIGDCTGNPVLIPTKGGGAVLLWSKFEDKLHTPIGKLLRLADRWKYCSLWIQRVVVENGEIYLQGKSKRISGPEQHLLGRCNPLVHNGSVLLPLYDEVERSCVIFEGKWDNHDGLDYTEIGRYGTDTIQPTLWCKGDKIGSLARNFSTHNELSQFCESANGVNWSEPTLSNIWNLNNSLHVVKWHDYIIILWNDTNGRFRKNLTLGVLKCETDDLGFLKVFAEPVEVVGAKYGAYPSMCIDNNGNLNFSFTNNSKQIEYHVWNHKFFRKRRNNRNSFA